MSFSTSPASLISGIVTFLGSPLLVTIVVLAISVLTWVAFALLTVVSVYSIVYLWAAFERGPANNGVLGSEFSEVALIDSLLIAVTTFVDAVAALLDMATSAAAAIAQFVVDHFVEILVFILVFAIVIIWDTYHNVIIQAAAPIYTCFIAPIVRTIGLTLTNLVSFAISIVLPVSNSIREVINEITLDAIIRALICGFNTLVTSLRLLSLAFSQTLFALVAWLQTAGVNHNQILDIGPDFSGAGATLGLAIANLGTVVTCACQRIGTFDVGSNIIEPIFAPVNSTAFASAYNETLSIVPVFLTQGIARPIVRTVQNLASAPAGASIFDVLDRPSLNSTFDTASAALNQTGALLTTAQYTLVNITLNILGNFLSACPSVPGHAVINECAHVQARGFCNVTAANQCAVPGFINTAPAPAPGNGCCFLFETAGHQCIENQSVAQCAASAAQHNAASVSFSNDATCASAQPLFCATTTQNCVSNDCPVATATQFTGCACAECFCTYSGNALGACAGGTDANTCAVGIAGIAAVRPPVFGTLAALLDIAIDSVFIQPPRYLANLVFNADRVFGSTDGFLFWRYTTGITVFNNGIEAIIADIDWLARVIEATGQLVATEVLSADGASLHPAVEQLLARKRALQVSAASVASEAIQLAFNFIGNVLFVLGNLLRDVVLFAERIVFTEMFDSLVGTIYFAIRSAIDSSSHIPNPFAFAAVRFGGAAHGIVYQCGFFDSIAAPGTNAFVPVFSEFVNSPAAEVCDESVELLNYCRFAFERVEGAADNLPPPPVVAPGNGCCRAVHLDGSTTCFDNVANAQCVAAIDPHPDTVQILAFGPLLPCFLQDPVNCHRTDGISLQFTPFYITATPIAADTDGTISACYSSQAQCVPAILPAPNQDATQLRLAVNDYNVTLQAGVRIVQDLDQLIAFFVPTSAVASTALSGFVEPLTAIVLPLIDVITHIPQLFSSAYVACLDVEGALNGINALAQHATDILREINTGVTGTACDTSAQARDSRILCALAQGVDSTVDGVVQTLLQLWRFAQLLVHILNGSEPPAAVVNAFTLDPVFVDIGNVVFDVLSVLTQVIPRTVLCEGPPAVDAGNGCCFTPEAHLGCCSFSTPTQDVCVNSQTQPQCLAIVGASTETVSQAQFVAATSCSSQLKCDFGCCVHQVTGAGAVCTDGISNERCLNTGVGFNSIQHFANQTCFNAAPAQCPGSSSTFALPVEPAVGGLVVCLDNINQATCANPLSPTFDPDFSFVADTACGTAFPGVCAVNAQPLQQVISTQLAIVATDLIVLIPKVALKVIAAIVNVFNGGKALDVFGQILDAILRPTLLILVDVFDSLANIIDCLGATGVATAFHTVANVINTIINVALDVLETLVEFVIYFVFGVIELFTVGTTELLKDAFNLLGDLILRFFIAILGSNFFCGAADAVCNVTFGKVDFSTSFVDSCTATGFVFRGAFGCTGTGKRKRDVSAAAAAAGTRGADTITLADFVIQSAEHLFNGSAESYFAGNETQQQAKTTLQHSHASVESYMHATTNTGGGGGGGDNWSPNDQFCGSYLATYGFERVASEYATYAATNRNNNNNADNSSAANTRHLSVAMRCYLFATTTTTTTTSFEQQVRDIVTNMLHEQITPAAARAAQMMSGVGSHWRAIGVEANTRAQFLREHNTRLSPDRASIAAHSAALYRREITTHGSEPTARRAVQNAFGAPLLRNAFVDFFAAMIAIKTHYVADGARLSRRVESIKRLYRGEFDATAYSASPRRKTAVQVAREYAEQPVTMVEKRALGFQLIVGMLQSRLHALAVGVGTRARTTVDAFGQHDSGASREMRARSAAIAPQSAIERRRLATQSARVRAFFNGLHAQTARMSLRHRRRTQDSDDDASSLLSSSLSRRVASERFNALAVLNGSDIISNDTASALGLFACDPTTQPLCSGCSILDSGVDTAVLAGQTVIAYFEDNTTGFFHQFDVFNFNLQVTIIDPLGSDVYTTQNKTTPSNLDDLFNIDWPWLWNYTQFRQILTNSTSAATPRVLQTFVNQTQALQIQRAAALNRTDIDNQVYATFFPVVNPLVNIGEQAVGAIQDSQALDTILNFFNVYIACDYQGALVCKSPLGIGLFNALAVTIVLSYVLLSLLTIAAPGAQVPVFMFLRRFFWFIVLWMAYGSSPLCTIRSFFSGIRGIPACFPVDANTILMRTFPQCPYVPPSLIDPRDLAVASTTLCAQCGTAPRLLDCATAVGFLNGFDVIFYILEVEFGPTPNAFFAQLFQPILPGVASVAALYTPAYVAALGQAGRDCAMILSPDILTAATELAFQLATIFLLVGFILGFALLVAWAAGAAIFANNGVFLQMERGFVYGTIVRKLALRRPGRVTTQKIE